MNIIIFSNEVLQVERTLVNSLHRCNFNIFRSSSITEFIDIIRIQGTSNTICLLILNSNFNNDDLLNHKHFFWSMNTIILLNEDDESLISLAHELHPCYLQFSLYPIFNTINVCEKIMENRS